MTIGAGGNYGNLQNKPGTDGERLLNAGEQVDLLSSQIQEQLDKINDLVKKGKKEGGEFWQPECKLPKKGNFCAPCYFRFENN